MSKKTIPAEALISLHRRLVAFAPRSHERRIVIQETAGLYDVSEQALYRALAQHLRPETLRRVDRGTSRIMSRNQLERY